LFVEEMRSLPMPVWVALGNHEIFGVERHRSGVSAGHPLYGKAMYEHYLGPPYYSFDYRGVHFITLDTASVNGRWYYGDVSAKQLAWLADDLSRVADDVPIVTINHIPLVSAVVTV
jgi:3',5'-cyclic AMP phosphodiesterase CpdA